LNILLVDDDYILAKSTAKLIKRLGNHTVVITEYPEEIIQQCQVGAVDLVLMDVNLPGVQWQGQEVSGAEICRFLKSQLSTAHIPIILLTAYGLVNERQALISASQADECCLKPITDYGALLALIDQLVQ
jgi:two-component system, cell cycle response regulator DivK